MKKTLCILFSILIGFASCDKVNDLKTKDFYDLKLSKKTLVTVNSDKSAAIKSAENHPFSETISLDFNDLSEVKEYLNKLEAVDVTSVTCKITDLSAGEVNSLNLSVPDLNFDFDIPTVSENQALFVNFTTEQLDAIANELLQSKNLKMIISGTVTEKPVSFNIETTALVDVEVKVL
ncbi:hypothetical protein GQR60_08585 [Labilibaculum sp. A4]|uniref:hypothetical protein n=1 Tax=Labilibaculum euxinus TaxID=2686357 RepID=UPI000F618E94|nr:hypothetical protein [Labilibaculum euxinus]MDQ1769838.1 hypothetical protein [Labilibaculum euxinus]MWN76395.1 hypothetical protein [Labilibaculum euxinus]